MLRSTARVVVFLFFEADFVDNGKGGIQNAEIFPTPTFSLFVPPLRHVPAIFVSEIVLGGGCYPITRGVI